MSRLMVCDICWSLWGGPREIRTMGSGGPCCVCDATRPCGGPITEAERDALKTARLTGQVAVSPPLVAPLKTIEAAGPVAVALRSRFHDADKAEQALGDYLSDRPEIGNDPQLSALADQARNALANYRCAISTKLRKLCGVDS